MRHSDRFRLHFGPYKTPRFKYGQRVQCAMRGELVIVGITDGSIPWPVGKRGRAKSLVLYRDLVRAVKKESRQAVCFWWGIAPAVVQKWRRELGVPLSNQGTNRLRVAYSHQPAAEAARRKAHSKAADPDRRAKIAAARRGKPRPASAFAAKRASMIGVKLSASTRRKISESHKRLGTIPPAAGVPWSAKEEALLRSRPAREVADRTGRTLTAVYERRSTLGLNNGRTTRHKRGGRNVLLSPPQSAPT